MEETFSYSKIVKICGMTGEEVRGQINDLMEKQDGLFFQITERAGEVDIQIGSKDPSPEEAKAAVKKIVRELKIRLGSNIFTTNASVTLEETIVQLLKEQGMKVATVESCTGGLVSGRLTNVAGVSEVFKCGVVTYSNRAKRKVVGVKKLTLKRHSAVSEQTAFEMAKGGAEEFEADACVSVTGYAGPEGGENGEPAGLVYIGCCLKGAVKVEKFQFQGDRQSVREQAVAQALILLRRCIMENYQI